MARPPASSFLSSDILASLPHEITLNIIKLTPDISSLWSIINASPICAFLFDAYALEIVDTVVSATVPASIQLLMQDTLCYQISADSNLAGAREILSNKRVRKISHGLLPETDSKALRRFLSLAHKIHLLSHACLDHYINTSLALRPRKLVKLPADRRVGHYREAHEQAVYVEFQPRKTGPPSWVEEHRVIKSLWLIHHFLELKTAYMENRLAWPAGDLEALALANMLDFYKTNIHTKPQLLTVYDFIVARSPNFIEEYVRQYPHTLSLNGIEDGFDLHCCPKTNYGSGEDHFQQGQEYLDRAPTSIIFHSLMSHDEKYSPLPGVPFVPYRKFGFAIFDDQRMTDLGFAEPDRKALGNQQAHFQAWFGILSEEEKQLQRRFW